MKKHIISILSAIVITFLIVWFYYKDLMSDCLGCGIAPDGITNLGPYFSDYLFNILTLSLLIIVYIVTFLISKLIIKK